MGGTRCRRSFLCLCHPPRCAVGCFERTTVAPINSQSLQRRCSATLKIAEHLVLSQQLHAAGASPVLRLSTVDHFKNIFRQVPHLGGCGNAGSRAATHMESKCSMANRC